MYNNALFAVQFDALLIQHKNIANDFQTFIEKITVEKKRMNNNYNNIESEEEKTKKTVPNVNLPLYYNSENKLRITSKYTNEYRMGKLYMNFYQ